MLTESDSHIYVFVVCQTDNMCKDRMPSKDRHTRHKQIQKSQKSSVVSAHFKFFWGVPRCFRVFQTLLISKGKFAGSSDEIVVRQFQSESYQLGVQCGNSLGGGGMIDSCSSCGRYQWETAEDFVVGTKLCLEKVVRNAPFVYGHYLFGLVLFDLKLTLDL